MGETNTSKNIEKRLKIEDVSLVKHKLLSELREIDTEFLILSSEFIFEAAVNGDLQGLKEALSHFEDVEVIAYVRHPLKHFSSLISQRVKSGQFKEETIYRIPVNYYNYYAIFEKISKHFKLRVYDFEAHKKSLVTHFFDTVGLEFNDCGSSERKNPALSQKALEFSIRINELALKEKDSKRRALIEDLNKSLSGSEKIFVPDSKKIDKLMKIAEDQNNQLVGKYLAQEMQHDVWKLNASVVSGVM